MQIRRATILSRGHPETMPHMSPSFSLLRDVSIALQLLPNYPHNVTPNTIQMLSRYCQINLQMSLQFPMSLQFQMSLQLPSNYRPRAHKEHSYVSPHPSLYSRTRCTDHCHTRCFHTERNETQLRRRLLLEPRISVLCVHLEEISSRCFPAAVIFGQGSSIWYDVPGGGLAWQFCLPWTKSITITTCRL